MEPKDPGKLFAEANRNLAKAVIILGFQALNSIQEASTQAQELVQDLVKEAQDDIATKKAKQEAAENSHANAPQNINIEDDAINPEVSTEPNKVQNDPTDTENGKDTHKVSQPQAQESKPG